MEEESEKRTSTGSPQGKRSCPDGYALDFGEVFAFTGIDIYSRGVDILLAPELTSWYGCEFLKQAMNRRFGRFVDMIQTDGGPEFKDKFKIHVLEYTRRYRIAHPCKKNEQAYIESFNRSLRKEYLGWGKYKQKELPILTREVNVCLQI